MLKNIPKVQIVATTNVVFQVVHSEKRSKHKYSWAERRCFYV